ncbi:MAG TPA: ABC transporter substrate-binding protein, partial [Dehalococcoidia bacterium]|nr:ABC transporter substrate-binding protein [Dehalococcoidia bacterium]
MGNRKKFWPLAALAALVLISLALAACGDDEEAGTPTATQRPRETISFDLPLTQYVDIVANLPFAVAQEKGFFAEEGLRPNIIPTRGGGDAVRAIEASAAPLGTA